LPSGLQPSADSQSRGGRPIAPPPHLFTFSVCAALAFFALGLFLLCAASTPAQQPPPGQSPPARADRPVNRLRILRALAVESSDTAGDLMCIACSVRVRGHVAGDIITIGGSVHAQGPVDGDVVAVGGGIDVTSTGKLSGDVFALGGYIENAGGAISRDSMAIPYIIVPGQSAPTALGCAGLAALNVLLVALAYAALRIRRVENTSNALHHRAGSVVFAGFLSVVFCYAANSLCMRLGRSQAIPEIILGGAFIAIASAGAAGVGFWAASFAFPNTQGVTTTLAGILSLTFLEFVPLFGFVVAVAGAVLSLGAAVVSAFGSRHVAPPPPPACDSGPVA
jgi:hypothetical protein